MKFYSHKESKNEKIQYTLLKDHCTDVVNKMNSRLFYNLGFSKLNFDKIIKYTGRFHDFGKYTTFFQDYLDGRFDGAEKNHSILSAVVILNYLKNKEKLSDKEKYLIYYFIRFHHSNLQSPGQDSLIDQFKNIRLKKTIDKQKEKIFDKKCLIKKEIDIDIFNDKYFQIFKDDIEDIIDNLSDEENIENYFLITYLFSLLIEADKLSASHTKLYHLKNISIDLVNNYVKLKPKIFEETFKKRNQVKQEIESSIENINIKSEGLFTITAPTGIGKTLSSLNFAIKLRDKTNKEQGYFPQIIYCLPFINIIDQTVDEFENVFKNESIQIIKHHSYTDIFSLSKETEKQDYDYQNYKMLVETWQGDIIITTFVQFLQTLIGIKNKALKKFNHFAGSIIIMDEVQSINCKYWPLTGASIYYLNKFLNTKIILMTATQPPFFKNLKKLDIQEEIKPIELLSNNKTYFENLNRTKIVPLLQTDLKDSIDFIEIFKQYYDKTKSTLIVVNTIKRSTQIFEEIKRNYENEINKGQMCLFYLSTSLVPKQRLLVIKKLKKLLAGKISLILVSTQSVEAGVDLNFDIGFRDIGPLDSIIQVAGRINREGDKNHYSPLYVLSYKDDSSWVYGHIIPKVSKDILRKYKEIPENQYQQLVEEYFNKINSESLSQQDSIEIFQAMKRLEFSSGNNNKSVSDFQLIDVRYEIVEVFIDFYKGKNKSTSILEKFLFAKKNKDQSSIMKMKKRFYSYVVSVNKKRLAGLTQSFQLFEDFYYIPNNMIDQYYSMETGFITEDKDIIF